MLSLKNNDANDDFSLPTISQLCRLDVENDINRTSGRHGASAIILNELNLSGNYNKLELIKSNSSDETNAYNNVKRKYEDLNEQSCAPVKSKAKKNCKFTLKQFNETATKQGLLQNEFVSSSTCKQNKHLIKRKDVSNKDSIENNDIIQVDNSEELEDMIINHNKVCSKDKNESILNRFNTNDDCEVYVLSSDDESKETKSSKVKDHYDNSHGLGRDRVINNSKRKKSSLDEGLKNLFYDLEQEYKRFVPTKSKKSKGFHNSVGTTNTTKSKGHFIVKAKRKKKWSKI